MSIKETAQQIISEAKKFMKEKHNINYFKFTIGQKNIALTIDGFTIDVQRWYGEQNEHHYYEISTNGYSNGFENLIGPFSDSLVYVQRYLEAYRQFKKIDGYILINNKGKWLSESARVLFDNFEQTPFTEKEKKLIPKHLYTENEIEFIAGVVSDEFTSLLKDSVKSISVVREVLEEFPICSLEHGKLENLMIHSIGLTYHGESIAVYIDKNLKKVVMRLNSTNEKHHLDLPLQKQHMIVVLHQAEEKNKMKNLLEPSHIFFSDFIQNHLCAYSTFKQNEQEEFDKLVADFGNWQDVEMIFKEINEQNQPYVSEHQTLMKYTDVNSYSSGTMESSCVKYKEQFFFFIKHRNDDKTSREVFKVFLSNGNKPPQAFNDYLFNRLNQTIEMRTEDL